MSCIHLTQEERYQIYAYQKSDKSSLEIAILLERSKSTISRELARNTGMKGYRPKQPHEMAVARSKAALKAVKMTATLIGKIENQIRLD